MTVLTSKKTVPPAEPPRRPRAGWIVAIALGLVLLVGIPLAMLMGDDEPGTTSSTTLPGSTTSSTTPTSVPVTSQSISLYFVGDVVESAPVPGPRLVPVLRAVDAPDSVGGRLEAAMLALIEGPSARDAELIDGVASQIPAATQLDGVSWSDATGVATIDLSSAFASGAGSLSMQARLAQVVYTATQFVGVDAVALELDGEPVSLFSSEGLILDGPQTRSDYSDLLPAVFAESPLPGTSVSSPVRVVGVANTFEATLQYRLELTGGTLLADGFATATCGSGCWGDFELSIEYGLGEQATGFIVLFESSARDGRPVNIVRIPVTIEAAEFPTAGLFVDVFADLPGGPPLAGVVTIEPTLTISGSTNVAVSEVTIDGTAVILNGSFFTAEVTLQPGENEILIGAGPLVTVYTVTYLAGGSTEFAFVEIAAADELVVDYAQWLTGDEANRAAFEDGVIGEGESVPNDYYIRNQNPQLRTLPLSPEVAISLPTPAFGSVANVRVTLVDWLGQFNPDGSSVDVEGGETPPEPYEPHFGFFGAGYKGAGYWLVLDDAGTVIQVTGQYRP